MLTFSVEVVWVISEDSNKLVSNYTGVLWTMMPGVAKFEIKAFSLVLVAPVRLLIPRNTVGLIIP